MKIKPSINGFTLFELVVGLFFSTLAALAIIIGSVHAKKVINDIRLKQHAFEALKNHTEFWKAKIAAGDIRNNSCESGEDLCLGSIGEDEECTFEANDLCFYISESAGSQNSKAKRYDEYFASSNKRKRFCLDSSCS